MVLLFHTTLIKYFNYSRINASCIVHGTTILITPTMNKDKVISTNLIGKSFLPFKWFTTHPQEKLNHQKNHAYLTDSP